MGQNLRKIDLQVRWPLQNSSKDSGDCTLKQPTIEIANSIWYETGTNLYQPYSEVVVSYLIQTDFQDIGAGGAVNELVEGMTHVMVESII